MELLNAIILLFSTVLPLVAAVITFIAKFMKSEKAKKAAENLIKINEVIEQFMIKAEKFEGYAGEEKKNYVLRCVKNFALSEGINFNEANADDVIEKLINFSNNVNMVEYCLQPLVETKKQKSAKKSVSEDSNKAN